MTNAESINQLPVSEPTKEFLMYRQTWLKKQEEEYLAWLNQHAVMFDEKDNSVAVLRSVGITNRRKLNNILNEAQNTGVMPASEALIWKETAKRMDLPL